MPSDEERTVTCCPNPDCRSTEITARTPRDGRGAHLREGCDPESAYWCRHCKCGFETPGEKVAANTGGRSKNVQALLDANAEDVLPGGSA